MGFKPNGFYLTPFDAPFPVFQFMARPIKIGLDYFPFDVDFFDDIKIRKLIKYKGVQSILIYIYIISIIYKNGYYIKWDDDFTFIISEKIGFEENYILDVIKYCIIIELFSKMMYKNEKILTSKGIQKRYNNICVSSKRTKNIKEYDVLNTEETTVFIEETIIISEETTVTEEETTEISELSTQSKVNESKVNESKVNEKENFSIFENKILIKIENIPEKIFETKQFRFFYEDEKISEQLAKEKFLKFIKERLKAGDTLRGIKDFWNHFLNIYKKEKISDKKEKIFDHKKVATAEDHKNAKW